MVQQVDDVVAEGIKTKKVAVSERDGSAVSTAIHGNQAKGTILSKKRHWLADIRSKAVLKHEGKAIEVVVRVVKRYSLCFKERHVELIKVAIAEFARGTRERIGYLLLPGRA